MAISKSTEKVGSWTAGAFLFSGRPDPSWPVPEALVEKLVGLWQSLPLASGTKHEPKPPAGLGYRGALLRDPHDRRWLARSGLVRLETASGSQTRSDPEREFEKKLLSSAPAGVLPEGLLNGTWNPT
jgi:hypothetical protein